MPKRGIGGKNNRQHTVSVIVCAYTEQRWDDLVTNIRMLLEQTYRPDEIIVVIDHNSALFERVSSEISGIIVVENMYEAGLSGGRNTGLHLASGELVAFIDEDAIPHQRWLEFLVSHYRDNHILGVGGAIRPFWLAGRPKWFPSEFDWVVGCTYKGMPESQALVRNLIGCNMSFRRQIFSEVGGFTNGIGRVGTRPVGCEETELCIRLHQHFTDVQLLYVPEAYVDHRVPAPRATLRYFLARCYSEGLSKALVVGLVGRSDGLSSEQRYTLQTLPQGVAHGLRDVLKLDFSGLLRASAIIVGLTATSIGYLFGRLALMHSKSPPSQTAKSTVGRL